MSSFAFKMIHNILPTKTRLYRMNLENSPKCVLCDSDTDEDLSHALIECSFNGLINDWILAVLFDIDPSLLNTELNSGDIVSFDIPLDAENKLPVVWFLLSVFQIIWNCRSSRKAVSFVNVKSSIEAELHMMKKTKFKHKFDHIESALNFVMF